MVPGRFTHRLDTLTRGGYFYLNLKLLIRKPWKVVTDFYLFMAALVNIRISRCFTNVWFTYTMEWYAVVVNYYMEQYGWILQTKCCKSDIYLLYNSIDKQNHSIVVNVRTVISEGRCRLCEGIKEAPGMRILHVN